MSKTSEISSGIDFLGMLFILFLGLKLANVIDWSWWWVFAPLWGPVAIAFAIVVVGLLAIGITRLFEKMAE